jgi:hypothetical protein
LEQLLFETEEQNKQRLLQRIRRDRLERIYLDNPSLADQPAPLAPPTLPHRRRIEKVPDPYRYHTITTISDDDE